MISQRFKNKVKLSDLKAYEIAQKADIHPTTLSRILHGIEDTQLGDPRVMRVGKVLGLRPDECFEDRESESAFPKNGAEMTKVGRYEFGEVYSSKGDNMRTFLFRNTETHEGMELKEATFEKWIDRIFKEERRSGISD